MKMIMITLIKLIMMNLIITTLAITMEIMTTTRITLMLTFTMKMTLANNNVDNNDDIDVEKNVSNDDEKI